MTSDEPTAETEGRRRGRPRSETARRAILAAARDLLEEGGLAAVTMERVAARAGVGKPTVYRHWSNGHEVAMAALIDAAPAVDDAPMAATPLAALRQQLAAVAALFASPMGRSVATMLAAADQETEMARAFRSHFIRARREEGRALLAAAVETGALRADLDLEVTLDLVYGPLFYRLMMRHGRLDRAFTDAVVDAAVAGLGARPGSDR